MKKNLTQCDRILRHLRDYGTITSLEAVNEYGILRLAARISNLKDRGYKIKSTFKSGKNRYGEPIRFSVYSMEEQNVKELR